MNNIMNNNMKKEVEKTVRRLCNELNVKRSDCKEMVVRGYKYTIITANPIEMCMIFVDHENAQAIKAYYKPTLN